ncbi:hypothetical protein ABPG72_020057 [Tetrahymena utriculariae]
MEEEFSILDANSFGEVEEEDSEDQDIPKKRGRKGLFSNVRSFLGKEFLKKSTPVVLQNDHRFGEHELTDYFESDLKDCIVSCQRSERKTNEIICSKTYKSLFVQDLEVNKVYMSMLQPSGDENNKYKSLMPTEEHQLGFINDRLAYFQGRFCDDFSQETYNKFIAKKRKYEEKVEKFYNGQPQINAPKITKKGISKERNNNHYTQQQINRVQHLIQLNSFKNYQQISLDTGVKVSTIKKVARQMLKDEPMRTPRKVKDSIESFSLEEKNHMLVEAVHPDFACLNLTEKVQRYNQLFQKNIRYMTYRNFFIQQGFSYRSLTYRPLATENDRNKWQVFKSSLHLLENFENSSDLIAIDESGLNEKCFKRHLWAPKGIEKKLARDVRLQNYSLIMAISMKFGVIAYQIKYQSLNSGYFLHFIKKALNYYQDSLWDGNNVCIIMENCRIHKMEAITTLMVECPFRFVFTAPYSSPMNPIEEVFGTIKAKLRQNTQESKMTEEEMLAIYNKIIENRSLGVI